MIETSELGYALNAKVVNLLETSSPRATSEKPEMTLLNSDMKNLLDLNLNSRQIQIMQYLDGHPFISVKIVVKLFLTSEITANRDLRALFEKKLVLRVGQGRATEYTKV